MVVAVVSVRMMKVTTDQVIDMIPMGNRLMLATGTMNMPVIVRGRVVNHAAVRVRCAHRDSVFFDDSVFALMMKMAVVEIIDVSVVPDRGVAAVFTVLVIVIRMGFAIMFTHNTKTNSFSPGESNNSGWPVRHRLQRRTTGAKNTAKFSPGKQGPSQ